MKKFTLIILTLLLLSTVVSAQIAAWNFDASGTAALNPTTTSANLTVSPISFGAGVCCTMQISGSSNCGTSYISYFYSLTFTSDDYWEFTLTPAGGYNVDVASIEFSARRSSQGPTTYEIRSSIDGYTSNLGSAVSINAACSNSSSAIDIAPQTSPVTFRIYFYGALSTTDFIMLEQLTINGDIALPIELTSFNAYTKSGNVQLAWQTASETNNAFFTIERSTDGLKFTEIGRMAGAGDSYEVRNYTFTDEKPLTGTSYYRLRQTDTDGSFTFSRIVSVVFGKSAALRLFPSPAADIVTVEPALKEAANWEIMDCTGRTLLNGTFEAETLNTIDIASLPAGTYIVRVQNGSQVVVETLVKQ